MDDLLQEAKHTADISTIDLKSGYHQVNVNPADRDKTAFVCPFGTYRFKRMPFGLKNAPATFQRLMDIFRRLLPVLAYLDDIIIMSPTFEQHLADLEAVFKRLMDFKLRANREKCQFSCSRVKYLGLWITPQGIEVDHEKTSAILGIPPPKNVKQLQSFLQTCSWWYRKFIATFSEIARPLSNLTKKKTFWKWSEEEEKAFQTLKQCLVSPPILKQADFSKLFLIRTDASNYALGAVFLQGEGKEEHPVEFASRLSPKEIRDEQMKDEELVKIISCLEDPDKNVNYVNWVERGYLMNQGVLFRYALDSESEESQLVIPSHERTLILKNHHDAPMAGHYGPEGTYTRIAKNYYWTGMRKYITDYVKNCPDCIKYKASNQKLSGLLQAPVPAQCFETLAIDLFGPLPESKDGKR
ncbi:retrovirus-related Pol polyprotein from transposon 17.6 [Trichonephila clavipes]|nr:retrovirus-related Pol polyprotein from transposon 17.6 [Trichonephila clavipes]